ncbi:MULTISPECIES: hypothetical protein [Paenibacillus]|jgi:type IV secretory pathway TrbF-like protein|uniref:Uncharacterized protein n=1 Tax=Paenibacillus odorifer TaxID=189426 RepID=A0A1R0WZQ3_9BACL|nr:MULTISPECIES: hypothetical protein [Paenibacillus]AIQ77017.1 hypothetical protein PODO_29455 [Paenibacillus odorifer]AWV36298.1 hypothetical protein CD191_28875 [Paenibacillus odorifer]MDH6428879.1 type IV secretory pathway TrbF-like protein [Paenibacillus sp. PastH-4]MDH6445081.1 type IV secretory pathway TrbF-like protein [Paenibacillus sp. PastF-4]MDH6528974.1 type IV secretory pathway TrbF-like protein [Paenibacillus sp. PastH-3]
MSDKVNEQELVNVLSAKTKVDPQIIRLVLKHEQTFINKAKANAKGEVDIDSDDLVDYVTAQRDVKLDEITVETILDAEMDYLMDKGLAGYID